MPLVKRATNGSALEWWQMDEVIQAVIDLLALNPNSLPVSQNGGVSKILATDANGNLGVGRAALSNKIEVAGSIGIVNSGADSSASLCLSFQHPSYGAQYQNIIKSAISANILGAVLSFDLSSGSNATTEVMRLKGGNLLVGETGGDCHMLSKTSASSRTCAIINKYGGVNPYGLDITFPNIITASTGYFLQCYDAGANRFIIRGNGDAQNVNNSYGALSDQKLKTNIGPARNYLTDLCRVQVRKYNFTADPADPQQLGVVAQELEDIFPGLVDENPDRAVRQLMVDDKPQFEQRMIVSNILGSDSRPVVTFEDDPDKPIMETYETGESTKSVKYSVFVPMLITAVQELKAKNDALEARLAALEEKLAI